MQLLEGYLLFRRFVSIPVLEAVCLLGALAPFAGLLAALLFHLRMRRVEEVQRAEELGWSLFRRGWAWVQGHTRRRDRLLAGLALLLGGLLAFLLAELAWRMMIEFLVAYLQVRDALLGAAP